MSQSAAKETPCPDCGEMVRLNSLRCWNCGAFMNSELEQRYMAMQANPAPIIFSKVPESEIAPMAEVGLADENDEDGFQLNVSVKSTRPAADTASGTPSPQKPDATPEEPVLSQSSADAEDDDDDFPGGAAESQDQSGSRRASVASEGSVPHSVATAGDALLDIAIQEEREVRQRNKGRKPTGPVVTAGGGLIIFCPYGCRVEVKEQHRGMTGRCPRCAAPFIVPIDPPQYRKAKSEESRPAAATPKETFQTWLTDLHLHLVEPEKLKLKADSLLKDFIEVDFGFSEDQFVVAILTRKGGGGLFAKGGEKKETVRDNMLDHLRDDKPLNDLPVSEKYIFSADEASQIRIVQPAENRGASLFHGIPVFGTGRIAIQLPLTDKVAFPLYVSMGITEFWKLARAMEEIYGIPGLGVAEGIPPEARTSVSKCHFSDLLIKSLEDVELFQADPTAKLEIVGYRCGACRTAVSETARKKENLGGKSPKGIGKAKCPKCGSKMGEHLLYALKEDVIEQGIDDPGSR